MISDSHLTQLSFIIPTYNERDTVRQLSESICKVMSEECIELYEVIFVDDGSNDGSWEEMEALVTDCPEHVRAIQLRKNFGKAAALNAGFDEATGEIVFTLDADLQDDPEEIPKFLEALNEGYDLVSGWKAQRNDPFSKRLPSKIFNIVTSTIAGIKLHDFNCGFKAYRKEVLKSISIYGELHRYIPVLAFHAGFSVGEIVVRHHPRRHGASKYGPERYLRGFLDLLAVLSITKYLQRPGHLFGGIGVISGLVGWGALIYLTVIWFVGIRPIGTRPLLQFGIMAVILSIQLISFGLLAEFIIRNQAPRPIDDLIKQVRGKPSSLWDRPNREQNR